MYQLICLSIDGDYVTEGQFATVEDAWKRNDDMGSRWVFYPLRVVIKTVKIVSVGNDLYVEGIGFNYQLGDYVGRNLSTLVRDLSSYYKEYVDS